MIKQSKLKNRRINVSGKSLVNRVARAGNQVPTYVVNKRIPNDSGLFSEFGSGMTWKEFKVVLDQVQALVERFYKFQHYLTEVYPQWQFKERIHWADNSIERVEYSFVLKRLRKVREVAPYGDICF